MSKPVTNELNANSEAVTAAGMEYPELVHGREDLSVFFTIGIIVNLTMFVALLVWGYRQWNKKDADKE